MSHPAATGQDSRRKRRFPWIRCRGHTGTSPRAQGEPRAAGRRVELDGGGGRVLSISPGGLH